MQSFRPESQAGLRNDCSGVADLGEHLLESEGADTLTRMVEGDMCGPLSFTPATMVATARGEQAIGTMQVGEKMWAYNPETHKMELEPVLHVWIDHDNDLVDLALKANTFTQHGKPATQTSETITDSSPKNRTSCR